MPDRGLHLRVKDILLAAHEIVEHTEKMTYDDFANDSWSIAAVLHNLTIIGEASGRLPEEFRKAHSEIPWNDIKNMRNILVHEYFGVDPRIIWQTLRSDIPEIIRFFSEIDDLDGSQSGNSMP